MRARGQVRRIRSQAAIGAVLICASGWSCRAAAADGLSAWQEITVLTLSKLEAAAANCGFRLDAAHTDILLNSAGLTLDEVHTRSRSASLQSQIDTVTSAYRADQAGACQKAWDTFGPDGTARGFLAQ